MRKSVFGLVLAILLGGVILSTTLIVESHEGIKPTLRLPEEPEGLTREEIILHSLGFPTEAEMQERALALGISPFLLGLG